MSLGELGGISPASVGAEHEGVGGVEAGPVHLSRYARWVKPLVDRLLAGLLLIVVSPLLAVVGLAIRLRLGSPIIYRQSRVGKGGEPFKLYKFRTMIPDRRRTAIPYVGPERRKVHKSPDDPRVVGIARALRSWRLDELPQLWNVMTGDMSLVGPRPEMPEIVARYEPWQHRRHVVKPGITGPWQISDQNGKLMYECTELDLEYVEHISFGRDVSLLARTPVAMLGRRRGY